MAGDHHLHHHKVCDGSSVMNPTAVLLQNDTLPCDPLWIPNSSATLHGAKSMVNFDEVGGEDTMDTSYFQALVKEENGDEDYDACLNPPGKKRRLSARQVQFLERNFEVENKLEPERKIQLAKELGLQPRQVAIWFQNRRARFKNKQLEKDYDSLKSSYDKLKVDYNNLLTEKENLNTELLALKGKLLAREKGIEGLKQLDGVNAEIQSQIPITATEKGSNAAMVIPKQEEASSAKSDVFDSDSPHSFLEPADSSNVFEPADHSDFSQDEEDDLSRSFLPLPCFPKLYLHDQPPAAAANSCNFEFLGEDQPFWSWSY